MALTEYSCKLSAQMGGREILHLCLKRGDGRLGIIVYTVPMLLFCMLAYYVLESIENTNLK
jgi:hypothetical protein